MAMILVYCYSGLGTMGLIDQVKQLIDSLSLTNLTGWGMWSYLLLAILVAVEGPIATLVGAAAASVGLMHPFFVFVAASMGNLTSDTLWYTLGYLGKMEWLLRIGKRLGINRKYLEHLEQIMCDHAPMILFFSKLSVSPMIPALVATGLVKFPWRRWFPYVFSAEMIWTGSLVLIGFFGGQAIKRVELGVEHAILAGSIVFIVFILWFGRRILKKEIQKNDRMAEGTTDE
jgi:membrane protein DedA with SNARE-associated domain